jgi:glutamyl-tRNA synthetase/glutamyl-Q tRNA(Asp) synthetase
MIHVWGLAARHRARVDIRIEDHDRQRCRPEYQQDLRVDLNWLGLAPIHGGTWSIQSKQNDRYSAAFERLRQQGVIYACRCSRKAIELEPGAAEGRYPGRCRELGLPETEETSLRVRLPDATVSFHDARHGWQAHYPLRQCGDFVIRDRHGNWTYQFAVVVDDLEDGIDWIIRGDDLLSSTGRQLLLAQMLGRKQPLSFYHHPLILNPDGTKLSKSEAATPIGLLREQGVSAVAVLARAAKLCGLIPKEDELSAEELRGLIEFADGAVSAAEPYAFA